MNLPGDFHSLRSVQEWLKRMRDECAFVAFAYAKATAHGWTGSASTRFDEYRHRARMRWLDVADAFGAAHDALDTYLYTHVEVHRLIQHSDPEHADRLWQQLAEEERIAVRAVGKAADELWLVRSELPERVVAATPPPPAPRPALPPAPPVPAPPVPAPRPVLSRTEDFMAKQHVETVVTTVAIAARYPHWQRWSTGQGATAL